MKVYARSLARTLDAINEAFFFGRPIPSAEREQVAKWIAERQGRPGSYADMFAPTSSDLEKGIRLFTGEMVRSGAALRHVIGEEACRALILLKSHSEVVQNALERASQGMLSRLTDPQDRATGMYCCGTCTPALWRHLAAGGLTGAERWLTCGMKALKAHRDGESKWRRFPFHYTLLALTEIELLEARREMKYAAPACERYLARARGNSPVINRRRTVIEEVLARC